MFLLLSKFKLIETKKANKNIKLTKESNGFHLTIPL